MAVKKSGQRVATRKKIEPLTKVVTLGRFSANEKKKKVYTCPGDCSKLTVILLDVTTPANLIVAI